MGEYVSVQFMDGTVKQYPCGTTLLEIAGEVQPLHTAPIVAAKVNNDLKDLQSRINHDCRVDFVDLTTDAGIKVYQRSLAFVMITAAQDVFPEGEVTVEHSLSKGFYCELHLGREISAEDVMKIKRRMQELIAGNIPIVRCSYPLEEAIRLFESKGRPEKVKLLKQLKRDKVSIYYCGNAYDYFYGTMAPNTSYLKVFDLTYFAPGFILRFPEKEQPDKLPAFVAQPKLARVFREAEQWAKILHCDYVATLNEHVQSGQGGDIVRIAEALHEKKIAQIADYIAEHQREARVILVAGPSSSGKTTFAQRLSIQLRVNGLRPVPISIDDYFIDRDRTPRDEAGNYDFENIEAIDLELFNQDITSLLRGEMVELPSYNFTKGEREYKGRRIRIDQDQPLIIEGIHGLNERLTEAVPREQKVKIYISALTQLSIDSHNRIPTTDTRLIRRIVRDSQFRAHDALATLKLWPAVRRGEDRNIFPFQEEADIMFNSALIYELGVLKKYAEPLLGQVQQEQPEYSEARRLLNFLEYFADIADEEVPANSILREFIGNCCFYR
ncbi:MAG: nucleoside kinase [Negativicutes bacterium]|nr:nucleoside kinase [Negativicutes bacterium]